MVADYWSSTLYESYPLAAYILRNYNNTIIGAIQRYIAGSVRAVYSPKEEVPTITATLKFDANGGSGEMTAISVWSDDNSTEFTIPSNSFVRDGYKFIGWNTQADGSGISCAPNEKVIFPMISLYTLNGEN